MKVFGRAISTNVSRVLVCLEEVGADYELVTVDFLAGEQNSPEHVERNVTEFLQLFFSVIFHMYVSASTVIHSGCHLSFSAAIWEDPCSAGRGPRLVR